MPALFLNGLKLLFLALLFVFLWQVALAVRAHLGGGGSGRSRGRAAEMVILRGDGGDVNRVKLRGGGHTIGRSAEADISIDDPYASEFHARVGYQDEKVLVHDLGSTNGTYVNGRRVTAPVAVVKGDTVQIGKTILEVR
jgi:pSer/pThr/pTyr-binding forkhead associated (FHA) protein